MDVKCMGYADQSQTYKNLTEDDQRVSEKDRDEHSETGSFLRPIQVCHHDCQGSGASGSPQSGKLKLLCSFGGKILPRPGDGKLRYVGGETRIVSISKNVTWKELMHKTFAICKQPHMIKYQLPGEELDALISVASGEDLQNMMEEHYGVEKADASQRLRLFLIFLNESENPSLDSLGLQSNSEYQYVVAVNNMLDPSPRKNSRRNSFSSQMGCHLDDSPSLHKESPSCPQFDVLDGAKTPNGIGIFNHHPAPQFFINSQSGLKSPIQSPPFSPKPLQQRDTRYPQEQSVDDQIKPLQPLGSYYVFDTGYSPSAAGAKLHNNSHSDVDLPLRSHAVAPLQDHSQMKGLVKSLFTHSETNVAAYSRYEIPPAMDISFDSKRHPGQAAENLGWVRGSDVSLAAFQIAPHECSDSFLQNQHERDVSDVSQIIKPYTKLSPYSELHIGNLEEGSKLTKGFSQLSLLFESQGTMPTDAQVHFSQQPELCGINYFHYQTLNFTDKEHRDKELLDESNNGSQDLLHGCSYDNIMQAIHPQDKKTHQNNHSEETETSMKESKLLDSNHTQGARLSSEELEALETSVPTSSVVLTSHPDNHMEHYSNDQINGCIQDISVKNCGKVNGQHGESFQLLNCDFACEGGNIIAVSPVPWPKDPLETVHQKQSAEQMARESSGDRDSNGVVDMPSNAPVSHFPSVIISQNMKNNQEYGDLNQDLLDHDLPNWFLSQTPAITKNLERKVSCLDQSIVDFSDSGCIVKENGFCGHMQLKENGKQSIHEMHDKHPIKGIVTVEDVTHAVPSSIPFSAVVVPHVLHETVKDAENDDSLSPKVTDAGIYPAESENEDMKAGERELDESISDAAIAEIEAGIYGLQIIKNADLEELHELGSGTFGTVYHGKWRGTDVAIKRIKKSCFAGRSSEQERLSNDFWREAQILSKLHHPNVVAFYGVVPDGAGGTLATVTEFMVNGSLRHVLLRKDSALDHRKKLIITMDAAFGMEYLHSKNIVHFDLKCDNLLVNLRDLQRPICKVGDFGLSRIKRNTLVSGGVRGTLPWMAPELLNGSSSRVSEKVDVFSFGIVMWEILTGAEPYANMHCGAIIGGILNNKLRPPIPERCESEWRKLMEQCWSLDPMARPSFSEITDRLRAMSMAYQQKAQTQANR
ncbi:PB1 [Musa troglodytarum]|nr:PB1 [Musa troglodytarum]